jgi:alkane 1-monooxygenase
MPAAIGLLAFLFAFTMMPLVWAKLGVAWMTLVVTFIAIPVLDGLLGAPRRNVFAATPSALARWLPRSQLLFQILLLAGATRMAPGLDMPSVLLLALAVGTATGGIGITVAHELGHRASKLDRAIARMLLASVLYAHFQIEHIRGHHVRVATPEDPATAPPGMNVYRFIVRSVLGGFVHACKLEALRLQQRGQAAWSPAHRVLAGWILSAAIGAACLAAGGTMGLVLFVLQAAWAVVLLEVVNYIEHYGLRRRREGTRYEPVSIRHSWNADFAVSNWFQLNLQLHSDHHAHMVRPYEQLRTRPQAPQLPAGYPAMVLLALVPPLWFRVMNRRLMSQEAAS